MADVRRLGRFVLVAIVAVLLVGAAALLHRIADAVRGSPIRELSGLGPQPLPPVSDAGFVHVASALADLDLEPGHTVEILNDEEVYGHLLADLAAASRSITMLMYYCEPGRIGTRLAEALAERARAGVVVMFLADDFGCGELVSEVRPALVAAGVRVASFRPVRWYGLHRAQHRNHARIVIVDGSLAYTGGFGIADKWTTGEQGERPWRDVAVRFTGPAVAAAQASFLAAWTEATGALHTGERLFPRPAAPDTTGAMAGLMLSEPELGATVAERFLALSLAGAERTLFLANAYFAPTPIVIELLLEAERRGVDVRVLVPGEDIDIPSLRWAGRSFYETLLEGGVRIWEYQPAMMHSKTLVVDGIWSMVGSLNLDTRSIRLNDEAGLVALHAGIGARLDSIFLGDLQRAKEITLAEFRGRSRWERLRERWFRLLTPLL